MYEQWNNNVQWCDVTSSTTTSPVTTYYYSYPYNYYQQTNSSQYIHYYSSNDYITYVYPSYSTSNDSYTYQSIAQTSSTLSYDNSLTTLVSNDFYSSTNSEQSSNEVVSSTIIEVVSPVLVKRSARKNDLPDEAIKVMSEWFDSHLNHPYPDRCEKERFAQLGRITMKQVNSWFSNRRKRSLNKKIKE